MDYLIWAGAVVSVAGLCGIVASILSILRARRGGLDDAALRGRLQQAMTINLAALFTSVIGLMMVVVGVLLA
ncbi:hypothetical protein [Paenirhodobacter populi]|uniref:Uncharacterized protein n=1 Tax=Paenirhodobacter populi TaxID=2306993 RepID=A0A443JUB6_9RHOB|nr:hypothetical protein [Sinirhodobacter populi]RWR24094.1 hypothetical protein D2T30_03025 [Sinirhodobacter populi]